MAPDLGAKQRGRGGKVETFVVSEPKHWSFWMVEVVSWGSFFLCGWKGLDPASLNCRTCMNMPKMTWHFLVQVGTAIWKIPLWNLQFSESFSWAKWFQFTLDHNLFSSAVHVGCGWGYKMSQMGIAIVIDTYRSKKNGMHWTSESTDSWNCTFLHANKCWGQFQFSECRWWPASAHRGFVRISTSEHSGSLGFLLTHYITLSMCISCVRI